jgi:hypothetical protein
VKQKSIWDKYSVICRERSTKLVEKCRACNKSQVYKDLECQIAKAEETEQQMGITSASEATFLETKMPNSAVDEWCCMHWVLLLQQDFLTEKPLI